MGAISYHFIPQLVPGETLVSGEGNLLLAARALLCAILSLRLFSLGDYIHLICNCVLYLIHLVLWVVFQIQVREFILSVLVSRVHVHCSANRAVSIRRGSSSLVSFFCF